MDCMVEIFCVYMKLVRVREQVCVFVRLKGFYYALIEYRSDDVIKIYF